MNTTKHKPLSTKQELLDKRKILKTTSDWVAKNKKIFWKYEVSCFYRTYTLRIANLPHPSTDDIMVSTINKLLTDQQKKQLCDAIKNASIKSEILIDSSIDMRIDFIDGSVVTELI